MIRCVLFDFAFTLFYPPDPIGILADAGLDRQEATELWDGIWRAAHSPQAPPGRDLSPAGHRALWMDLLAPADQVRDGLADKLYGAFCHPRSWLPYPGVSATLVRLRSAGYRLGLVSNTVFDLRPVMLSHGLHDHFTEYILSFEIGAEKPSATVFDTACAKLGAQPHECLMVGDSAWADGGAAETGVPTLILPRDHDATADRLRVLSLLLSGKG